MYQVDSVYLGELYPVVKIGNLRYQYVLENCYAKDNTQQFYYPVCLDTQEILIMCKDDETPELIPEVLDIDFANINRRMTLKGRVYYEARPGVLGELYVEVMTQASHLGMHLLNVFQNAGMKTQPFRWNRTYESYVANSSVEVYERIDQCFIFSGDREVLVDFDVTDRLHRYELTRSGKKIYYDMYHTGKPIYYRLKQNKHKIYFYDKNTGMLSDEFKYNFKTSTQTIYPRYIGQDLDKEARIFNYAIDQHGNVLYFFDMVEGHISKFDWSFAFDMKHYYSESPSGERIYEVGLEPFDDQPLQKGHPDMIYEKDADGSQVYPVFRGTEYCLLNRYYAKDSKGREFYPKNINGSSMVLIKNQVPIYANDEYAEVSGRMFNFLQKNYVFLKKTDSMQPDNKNTQPVEQDDINTQPVQPDNKNTSFNTVALVILFFTLAILIIVNF